MRFPIAISLALTIILSYEKVLIYVYLKKKNTNFIWNIQANYSRNERIAFLATHQRVKQRSNNNLRWFWTHILFLIYPRNIQLTEKTSFMILRSDVVNYW